MAAVRRPPFADLAVRARGAARALARDERGGSALEFAFVGMMLTLLIGGILEVAMILFVDSAPERAAAATPKPAKRVAKIEPKVEPTQAEPAGAERAAPEPVTVEAPVAEPPTAEPDADAPLASDIPSAETATAPEALQPEPVVETPTALESALESEPDPVPVAGDDMDAPLPTALSAK